MINNLLLTFMIVGSIGGATNSAYLTKKETPTKHQITKPNKQNETQNFSLNMSRYSNTGNQLTYTESKYQYSYKQEYRGENSALNVKMESITQTEVNVLTNRTYPTFLNTPSYYCTMLNKYEITPYRYLTNTENTTKLTFNLKLDYIDLIGGQELETTNLKLLVSTYTTTQNWSQYIGMSNWYTQHSNNDVINQIENPINQQLYRKTQQIYTLTLTKNSGWSMLEINQDIEIIKYNDENNIQQNYVFMYIQPYTELEYSGNLISFRKEDAMWAHIDDSENAINISGYMIPPVNNYEVIDIPALLFNILTMPFAFISTAFNLTLFPGTPYQINLSNLFLTIMAILIFVFIVKIFVKIKG